MGEKMNDGAEKVEDVMLPGFRFHPTDEELVGFYLKKKIQGRALPMELIKQVDIYKYDPWDLPKYGRSGEKEWYYYCARDRKYRNSARPNRVTGGGFWKATGTDRPIYSSSLEGSIIGLKKSLVFYRGRAAKGMKTEWMMHEFRLPPIIPIAHHSYSSNNQLPLLHNNIPPNDSWAICRIFKKTSTMAAQRALLSHSWAPHYTTLEEKEEAEIGGPTFQLFSDNPASYLPPSTSASFFSTTPTTVAKSSPSSSCFTNLLIPAPPSYSTSRSGGDMFDKSTTDTLITSSLHPLGDAIHFPGSHHFNGFSIVSPPGIEEEAGSKKNPPNGVDIGTQWAHHSIAFPFSLPWEEDSSPTHHLFQPTTPILT